MHHYNNDNIIDSSTNTENVSITITDDEACTDTESIESDNESDNENIRTIQYHV